jgi:hypothetical protein
MRFEGTFEHLRTRVRSAARRHQDAAQLHHCRVVTTRIPQNVVTIPAQSGAVAVRQRCNGRTYGSGSAAATDADAYFANADACIDN